MLSSQLALSPDVLVTSTVVFHVEATTAQSLIGGRRSPDIAGSKLLPGHIEQDTRSISAAAATVLKTRRARA